MRTKKRAAAPAAAPAGYRYDETADLAQAKAGDNEALGRLIVGCEPKIRNTLVSQFRDVGEHLDDIMQIAKFRAFRYFPGFVGDSTFNTWMTRIAINAAKRELSDIHAERKQCVSMDDQDDDTSVAEDRRAELMDPARNNPEDIIANRQFVDLLKAFEKTCPPVLFDGFQMLLKNQVEDVPYLELAEEYNIPVGTVRSRIFRARQSFADFLSAQGGGSTAGAGVGADYTPKQRRNHALPKNPELQAKASLQIQ